MRFFGSLDPAAKASVLSVESRREMTRPHWKIEGMSGGRTYGVGTAQREIGHWSTVGHGGGFQGMRTYTACTFGTGLTVSFATHAIDGDPSGMAESALRILQVFADGGAPSKKVADWSGRFWSLWGASDFVPLGNKVLVAIMGAANPFAEVSELAPIGPDPARIGVGTGYGS